MFIGDLILPPCSFNALPVCVFDEDIAMFLVINLVVGPSILGWDQVFVEHNGSVTSKVDTVNHKFSPGCSRKRIHPQQLQDD